MGYSRSLSTIYKNEALLAPLLLGASRLTPLIEWSFAFDDAPRRAAKIRECFAIARAKRREVPQLAEAADLYEIRVRGTKVQAIRRATAVADRLMQYNQKSVELDHEIMKGNFPPEEVQVSEPALSSASIIQRWLDHHPSTLPLHFLEVHLSPAERGELVRFGGNMEPPWEVVEDGRGLILRPEGVSL